MRSVLRLGACAWLCIALRAAQAEPAEAREGLPLVSEPLVVSGPGAEQARLAALRRSGRDFLLGLAAQDHADLTEAAAAYRRALEADPAFVEARVNLARVLLDQGEPEQAQKQLDRALAARVDYPPAYAARGLLALRAGDLGRARNELARALLLDPDSVEARVNLAAVHIAQRELPEARAQLERALELEPRNPQALFNRALVEDLSGKLTEALFYYDLLLDLGQTPPEQLDAIQKRVTALVSPGGADATQAQPR